MRPWAEAALNPKATNRIVEAAEAGTYAAGTEPEAGPCTKFPFQINLPVCSWCTSVPAHTRRILLPGLTLIAFLVQLEPFSP